MRGLHTLARDGASEETAALLAAPGLRSSLVLRQAEAVEEAVQRAELVDTRVTPGYRHARGDHGVLVYRGGAHFRSK
eukprot:CAMPEP_0182899200 /NCGR_PEP_ID=MMETSP0034_2-20130328/27933_1 /TAXON_ID=156128 /ORGANISM="Nephroselmis pyriformis, Strain CCMP717" /LENGTH=76 /DNA_ID=CAMNT_0025033209 /DNA_START=339 /DNA_END=569 /DNA_ORIENTATION=+